MARVKPRLKLVDGQPIPLPKSRADKLASAIGWLRSRNRYVLDKGARKPTWGIPGEIPKADNPLLAKIDELDKRRG